MFSRSLIRRWSVDYAVKSGIVLGWQEGVREHKEAKVHKEKTEQKLATEVELEDGASPEDEEESSISSTSKPATDIKVTATFL
jgi:hypothetical protein